jgi:8-oxo-dGTP diphosphatase
MEDRPKVGVGVLIFKNGKALLLKRKGAHGEGSWCYPGGHMEFGESFFNTAIREAEEESGLKVKNPRFLCITNDIFEIEKKHYITIFVVADYVSGEAKIMEKDRCTDIGWFEFDKLPKPLFISTKNMIEKNCFPENWRDNLSD